MIAMNKALRRPFWSRLLIRLGLRPPMAITAENRETLRTLRRFMAGHATDKKTLEAALHTVILRVQPVLNPRDVWSMIDEDDWDPAPTLDEGQALEARSAILRGQIDEALIHLERALPAHYADIAERLAFAFRSRT